MDAIFLVPTVSIGGQGEYRKEEKVFYSGCIIRAKTDSRSRTKNCPEQDPKHFPEQQPKFLTKFRRGSKKMTLFRNRSKKLVYLGSGSKKITTLRNRIQNIFLKFSVAIKYLYYVIFLPSPVSRVEIDILEFLCSCVRIYHTSIGLGLRMPNELDLKLTLRMTER